MTMSLDSSKGLMNSIVQRSQIMLMTPLPSINKTFSFLIQQERELIPASSPMDDAKVLVNTSEDMTNRNKYKGKTFGSSNSGMGRGSGYNGGRGRGNSNTKMKHGFPPHYKKPNNINNMITSNEEDDQHSRSIMDVFTPDQRKAILAMIKESGSHQ
ncbi:hypothetical protein Lal_00004149, partial [Lupinus albus]